MRKLRFIEPPTKINDIGNMILPQLSKNKLHKIKGGFAEMCANLESCTDFTPCTCSQVFTYDSCIPLKTCGTYCENKQST